MTTREKTGLRVLIGVVVVGLAWYLLYQPGNVSSGDGARTPPPALAGGVKAAQQAQIRFELLEPVAAEEAGRKNLFQYRQRPLPSQPPPRPAITPPPPMTQTQATIVQSNNFSPVFRTFRYEGFTLVPTTGKMLAALSESGSTYTVEEGECLLGQYCVRRITENQVEIEDVFQKRRQTFTRIQ
jgi:hypothetical protein